MAPNVTLILNGGGLRSLVTLAALIGEPDHGLVTLVHVRDGRPSGRMRRESVRQQAEHFKVKRTVELDVPYVWTHAAETNMAGGTGGAGGAGGAAPLPNAPFWRAQTLMAAMAHALAIGARRLIWPVQLDGAFDAVATVSEQVIMIEHLAQLEAPSATPATVQTPLLELTDRQVMELGGQLYVPWELTWTCQESGNSQCLGCDACRRRTAAFAAAGIVDPLTEPAGSR